MNMDAQQKSHFEATLATLEAQRAELDAAIAVIRRSLGLDAESPPRSPLGPSGGPGGAPLPGVYLGLSIPEAAKKHLAGARSKLSTKDLMAALEAGGLPPSKYNTVYGVLRRRESVVGDIINMGGDWALAEWYPNHVRKKAEKQTTLETPPTHKAEEENKKPKKVSKKDPKAQGAPSGDETAA